VPTFAATFEPDGADLARLREGVLAHARAVAVGPEPQPVACFAREGDVLVGGASGRIESARLFVNYLWVDTALRRQGLGSALLADLEAAARDAGCRDALIETLMDDSAALYRKLGWQPVAEIADYVPGFTRRIFVKRLG
jgi:GNAT superfamily N-acetyltransferase